MGRPLAIALASLTSLAASREARSQPVQNDTSTRAPSPPAEPGAERIPEIEPGSGTEAQSLLADLQNAPPPPTEIVFLQYGVALTAEVVSTPGPLCDNVTVPCILGTGGGIAIRAGWRGARALYLGGAYELSKQDPNKLLRLAIMQQARAEVRYYFVSGRDTEPYLTAGVGVAGYGNEWRVDTWGPMGFVGVGVEAQISRSTVVGVGIAYRLIDFQSFRDSTGAFRDAGLTQLFGLDFVLEQREPIYKDRVTGSPAKTPAR